MAVLIDRMFGWSLVGSDALLFDRIRIWKTGPDFYPRKGSRVAEYQDQLEPAKVRANRATIMPGARITFKKKCMYENGHNLMDTTKEQYAGADI